MIVKSLYRLILFLLLINLFIVFTSSSAMSKDDKYEKLKNQSYEVIAEALYNKNTYSKFKLEIIEKLGKLSDPTGYSYTDESFNKQPIYRLIKSMMAAVTNSMNKKHANSLTKEDYALEGKVESIVNKGDASIAYMLKDALAFPDYTIQLYAATALMQVKEESASPLFVEMLETDKNQDKIVALNVLGGIGHQESFDRISEIAVDKSIPLKTRIIALKTLEKLDPEKKAEISRKLMMDPEEDIMQESIAFLASQKDPKGLQKYNELLKNKYSKKKAINRLPKIVEALQEDSIEIVKLASQGDNITDKIVAYDSFKNLKDKSNVIELLKDAYNQKDPQLKVKAFEVLLDVDDANVASMLADLELENPEYYSAPVKYIIDKNDKKYDYLLKAFMDKSSLKVQLAIADYLLKNNREEEFARKALVDFLNGGDINLKEVIAVILLEHGYEDGLQLIKDSLKSGDSEFKARMIVTLANYGDKDVIPFLEDSIKNNKNINKTFGAALLLSNLGEMDYVDVVEKYLAQENITEIDEQYVHLDMFNEFLNNIDPMVRLNAAITLYEKGDKSALDKIVALLNSKDVKVRAKSAKFLGEYADKEVINKLQPLLDDEYVRVRVNASEALLRIINREDLKARS